MYLRDSFDEIRRQLERLDPVRRQMELLKTTYPDLDAITSQVRMSDLIAPQEQVQAAIARLDPVPQMREALEAAIRPFPDLKALMPQLQMPPTAIEELNSAIRQARYLAEITFVLEDAEGDDDHEVEQRVDDELIEVVSPEVLERLRRVEHAPFTLLDRVRRHPEAMRALEARQFEEFVAALVEELGFEDVVLTPRSGDGGRDVLATTSVAGIPIFCAFECKRYAAHRPVGPDAARALLGVIRHRELAATKGILVTTSRFTPAASHFIVTEPSLAGVDYDGILSWLGSVREG